MDDTQPGDPDAGTRFVRALAARDTDALQGVLADGVTFRGMTPGRFWAASTSAEAVHEVLYRWFEPSDVVEEVLAVEPGAAHDRPRVDYRFRVRNDDGVHLVEQRAYYDLDAAGRIARMHVVCAGFRPL